MAESKIKDENYYQISGFMINRLGLKGVPLNVYAIIYGFSQDGESEYTGSLQYLCDFCGGVSKPTIINALKKLTEAGYILRRENLVNGISFPRYCANLTLLKKFNGGIKENSTEAVKNLKSGGNNSLPNNKDNNYSLNNKDIYIVILQYLNEKSGKHFKTHNKATQQHINARLAEGYTVEDFKTVIDKKCAEWCGTDFEQYLRPATLFGTKFESYLNAPVIKRKQYGANGVEINTTAADDLAGIL